MEIQTAEDAIAAYMSFDDWQYADREAIWKWMFEQGRMAEREACALACKEEAAAIRSEGEGSTSGQYDAMAVGAERCAETLQPNKT